MPGHEQRRSATPIPRRRRRARDAGTPIVLLTLLLALPTAAEEPLGEAAAAPPDGVFDELLGAFIGGEPLADVVLRWEYAKQDQQQHSHGATARTRLGYRTDAFRGFTALAEMVNTVSPKPSGYFDGVEDNEGPQTLVADPERTDFNQGWLQFVRSDWAGLELRGGRQRINLDDDRWIGSVGWRQNEQTFDAARFQTTLGIEALRAQYIYTWEVNRIYADQGPPNRLDFDPRGHFLNLSYSRDPATKLVVFAYLLDPDQDFFRSFASQTYGTRLTGSLALREGVALPFQVSYAYQEDWGNNQVSYGAHYAALEGGVELAAVGGFSVGYEHLGSDTDAVVVTPLATAHKFNGFADAFLDNGGTRGLRDLYFSLAPAIPGGGMSLELTFHQFWDDQGGDDLGREYDLVGSWSPNAYVTFLWKAAYFDGGRKPAYSKITRSTLQVTFRFPGDSGTSGPGRRPRRPMGSAPSRVSAAAGAGALQSRSSGGVGAAWVQSVKPIALPGRAGIGAGKAVP